MHSKCSVVYTVCAALLQVEDQDRTALLQAEGQDDQATV